MLNTILARKGEISQTFVKGRRTPVTRVLAGPCVVTQIKKMDKDGYWSIQLGFRIRKAKNTPKSLQGHLKRTQEFQNSKTPIFPRYLREIRLKEEPKVNVGDRISASDIFKAGDFISVTGTSKGKGFAGVVKRWGFAGGPRTHGQSDRERAPGSIGQRTTPGRVYKGKRMAGRMGTDRTTVKNLQVVSVDPETNELSLSGPIPGVKGGLLTIRKIREGKLEGVREVQAQVVEGEPETKIEQGEQAVEAEQVKKERDTNVES